MKVSNTPVTRLLITDVAPLDPISVVLDDISVGRGKVVIECYGQAWSAGWGAMGKRTVAQFVHDMNDAYLLSNLAPDLPNRVFSPEAFANFARRTVIERRRGASVDFDWIESDKARRLYDLCDQLSGCDSEADLPGAVAAEILGPDWWLLLDRGNVENHHWRYLLRIIRTVRAGLVAAGYATTREAAL